MPAPTQLILTIAPDGDGKAALRVSLHGADGTQGPPQISVDLDRTGRGSRSVDAG